MCRNCSRKFRIVRFNVGACCVSRAADEEMISEMLRYQVWSAEGYGDVVCDKRKHEKKDQSNLAKAVPVHTLASLGVTLVTICGSKQRRMLTVVS